MTRSLPVITAFMFIVIVAVVSSIVHAASVAPELDNNVIAVNTPFVLKVNMTQGFVVNASTWSLISLNITVPNGYSIAYILIAYTDNSGAYTAEPLNITWNAAARNLTIYVNVSNTGTAPVTYNDLNVTLVVVPIAATTTIMKFVYSNTTHTEVAEASLSVNGTTSPVGYTPGLQPSYSVSMTCLVIAGPASLEYTFMLLNTTSLGSGYINETFFQNYLCVAFNDSYTASIDSLKMPTSVVATFGANTTTISISGVVMRVKGLTVNNELMAPSTGYYEMVVIDGARVGTLEVNVSKVGIVAGVQADTLKLNTSSLGLIYSTNVSSGYVNATASNAEVGLLNVNATSSLEFVNASGITGAKAYLALVNTPSLTADTAWSIHAYLSKIATTSGSVSVYGASLYDMVTGREASVVIKNLPTPGTGDINVTLEADLDLGRWVAGTTSVPEFREVLVYAGVTPEAKALILLPFQNTAQWSYTTGFETTMTVVAVNMTLSDAYYLAGGANSVSITLNRDTPFLTLMWAPERTTEVAAESLEYGYGVGLVNITIAPSILVADGSKYNASVTLGLSGAKFVGYVIWFDGFLPVTRIKQYESGGEINVTVSVSTPVSITVPVYHGIKVGVVIMVPNVTGTYTVDGRIALNDTSIGLLEKPASTTMTIKGYAGSIAAYIASNTALNVYLGVLVGNDYAAAPSGTLVWFNESIAPQVYGKILLLGTSYDVSLLREVRVRYTPADNKFALIGMNGVASVQAPLVNVTVPLEKVCLIKVTLTSPGFIVNSTSGYTGMVMISDAQLGSSTSMLQEFNINATTVSIVISKVYATSAYVNLTTGVMLSDTIDVGSMTLRHGELAVFYSAVNIGTVTLVDNAKLRIYTPTSVAGDAANYVVESVPNATVVAGPSYTVIPTTATSASVTILADTIQAQLASAPQVQAYVVVYSIAAPITVPGRGYYVKIYDIAVVGATPSQMVIEAQLPPQYCVVYNAKQLAGIVSVYYYSNGTWVKGSGYGAEADITTCRLTITFNSTSTPAAGDFVGLPVAIMLPPAIPLVGLEEFMPLRVVAANALLPVYTALAAIIFASLVALYAGIRRE